MMRRTMMKRMMMMVVVAAVAAREMCRKKEMRKTRGREDEEEEEAENLNSHSINTRVHSHGCGSAGRIVGGLEVDTASQSSGNRTCHVHWSFPGTTLGRLPPPLPAPAQPSEAWLGHGSWHYPSPPFSSYRPRTSQPCYGSVVNAVLRGACPYGPEDDVKDNKIEEDEHLQDDGLSLDGQDGEYLFNDDDDLADHFSCQNSPLSNGTNPDAGYASPLSNSSDQLADLKSTPTFREVQEPPAVVEDKPAAVEAVEVVDAEPANGFSLQDSLEQMKAVYANLISEASWSSIALDMLKTALAKTLQHTPYHLLPEPSLFSTVQLYRQNNKLYGPVFTGASKFRCKDCSGAYDTLVGLTVHMNESGHYRDDNKDKEEDRGKRWSKPRKRSLMEMEGKEDAQKVLKCMYCGHSFESLQDLSVHMIKTKHYQKVPLKEPMPTLTSKLVEPLFSTKGLKVLPSDVSTLIHSPNSPSPPPNRKSNMLAMEELVEKGKTAKQKELPSQYHRDEDQPMDLTKSKNTNGSTSNGTPPALSNSH
ncbi:hypothetical protein NHX12_023787, partial [Muraenolepis orangiensis]